MKLRFTIRDLLWLTLVVAMGLGWWLDHRQAQRNNLIWWRIEQRNGRTVISDDDTGKPIRELNDGFGFVIEGRELPRNVNEEIVHEMAERLHKR
jgi:hypothetical protein